MRASGGRMWLGALLALALAAGTAGWPPAARAQAAESGERREKPDLEYLRGQRNAALVAERNAVRPRITRYLERAIETQDEEGPEAALEVLERLDPERLNPGEQTQVYRLMGFLEYGIGNFEEAVANFKKVIELGILPIDDEIDTRFSIAQLYAANQQWEKAIEAVEDWLWWTPDPDPLGYYLKGIAHFQLQELDQALEAAETAISMKEEPPESWLQLLAALYVQSENYAKATPVLERLVINFPKKEYWVQLALLYGAQEEYGPSLAAQQIAYMQGFLTKGNELERLARSYLFRGLPYQAAQVIHKGLEDGIIEPDADIYEMLANSWIQAREFDRSIAPLRRAAELSEDGDLYVRLGQVKMQREQWQEAVDLFQKAIEKGGLSKPGSASLLIGICLYNDGQPQRARGYFRKARGYEESREQANVWIGHIDKELAQSQAQG